MATRTANKSMGFDLSATQSCLGLFGSLQRGCRAWYLNLPLETSGLYHTLLCNCTISKISNNFVKCSINLVKCQLYLNFHIGAPDGEYLLQENVIVKILLQHELLHCYRHCQPGCDSQYVTIVSVCLSLGLIPFISNVT